MAETQHLLTNCLYFTANSLARVITRMAEEAFSPTGLSPSHAFLLILAIEQPGITPGELAGHLHLAPSTVTRLIETLLHKGLVEKSTKGKSAYITPTPAGLALAETMARSWKSLYHRYSEVLGEQAGIDLTGAIHAASLKLEQS